LRAVLGDPFRRKAPSICWRLLPNWNFGSRRKFGSRTRRWAGCRSSKTGDQQLSGGNERWPFGSESL